MPMSLFARNKLLDHLHGKAAYSAPTAHIGLSTTTPDGSDGNVTEPVGNGYGRVTTSAASWTTAASGAITNAADLTFATASGSGWGLVTHAVAYDAPTGGNLLWWGSITGQTIAAGVTAKILAGDADSTLS